MNLLYVKGRQILLLFFLLSFVWSCSYETKIKDPFCGKESWKGNVNLLFFGYAGCQNVCPRMLQKISALDSNLQKAWGTIGQPYRFWMISVAESTNYEADVKTGYSKYSPNLVFLQCSKKETEQLAFELKAPFSKNIGLFYGKEPYDHSESIFLISQDGILLDRFHFSKKTEEIAEQMIKLRDL